MHIVVVVVEGVHSFVWWCGPLDEMMDVDCFRSSSESKLKVFIVGVAGKK